MLRNLKKRLLLGDNKMKYFFTISAFLEVQKAHGQVNILISLV